MLKKLFATFIVFASAPAFAQSIQLEQDQSKPLIFSKPATGVVVGNASIADVIVHDAKTIIVLGKSIGSTHVLILGEKGKTLYSGIVKVNAGNIDNILTVQRGTEISTSQCQDRCISVVSDESSNGALSDAAAKIRARGAMTSGIK